MKVYYTNTLHELLSAMLFVSNLQIQQFACNMDFLCKCTI